MAKQLVNPNFDIIESAGWCLQYARRVFGAPAVESTAWQGWMMTEHPHEDRNFPEGVVVPVWFDWSGDVGDGKVFRYGHVAVRAKDGRIWSSPLSGKGSAWFNSVDDLTRAFGGGMRYVGWSEDISDVKVIEIGGKKTMDKAKAREAVNLLFLATNMGNGKGGYPTAEQLNYWSDRLAANADTLAELSTALYKGKPNELMRYKAFNPEGGYPALVKQIEQLKSAPATAATELKPGLYKVK